MSVRADLIGCDGQIVREGEWVENGLTNDGQTAVLNTFFRGLPTPPMWVALVDQATAPPDATQTMDPFGTPAFVESQTPGVGGYARQPIASGDWPSDPELDAGNVRISAIAKIFGPFSSPVAVSHVLLVTVATGYSGLVVLYAPTNYYVANADPEPVASGQAYRVFLREKLTAS